MKYKTTIEVEAMQWDGTNEEAIRDWCCWVSLLRAEGFSLHTRGGWETLEAGDYVVKEANNTFSRVSQTAFKEKYKHVSIEINQKHEDSAPYRRTIANQRKELRRLNKMLNLIRTGIQANKMSQEKQTQTSVWDNKKAMHSFIRPREM